MTRTNNMTSHLGNFIQLVSMHQTIMHLGNEFAEELWFMTYPDGADYDDQIQMAKDNELMGWLREDYQFIMSKYA